MRRSVLFLCALALACGSSGSTRKLVLLHTNDEHSHLLGFSPEADDFPPPTAAGSGAIKGGVARRAVVLKTLRDQAAGADTLTVSAGDNMMGTLMQIAATTASADYRVMKSVGYDVTTLGNHEFDYGPTALAGIVQTANGSSEKLPVIVATNIHFSGTSGDAALAAMFDELGTDASKPIHRKWVVTTPNGLKVGFIGIMGADAAAVAPLKAPVRFSIPAGTTDDNRIAALSQIADDVQPFVTSLRQDDKVDLVVALSHSGANADGTGEDFEIAKSVSGIDVVVSGHSHTDVPAHVVVNPRTGRNVLVQQAGRFGDQVGQITLSVDSGGQVSFDTANSRLVPVDDKTVPDATVSGFVTGIVNALETTPVAAGKPSFLAITLSEILAGSPGALTRTGGYYNYPLAASAFDVDNGGQYQETELLDLVADSLLAAANTKGPTQLAVEASGAVRVSSLKRDKNGQLDMGDVFMAVPLGASPKSGTPGYPLCRFAILLAEVKAAMEVTAGFAYQGHNDTFIVPAGFRFEYDTTRPMFNAAGDPLDKTNGRVTRIWQLKTASLASGQWDGDANYDLIFDANSVGWMVSPLTGVPAAASLYIASFATFAGVHLRDPNTGAPVPNNDPTQTIVTRSDTTEIKEWEALGAYVHAQAAANGGTLPDRYNKAGTTELPRRAICTGANAVNKNCSH